MKNQFFLFFLAFFMLSLTLNAQSSHRWCASSEAHENRLQNDSQYASFFEAALNMEKQTNAAKLIPCDGTNSVIIPMAFHFDSSFSCADVTCLLTKVQAQIDVLNTAYGNQTTNAQNIALDAACPAGYPLADVSDGACIEFRLAVPPAGSGLDAACDPAITVGEFEGGTQTDHNGAGATWAGYLNIFVAETVDVSIFGIQIPGIIGISDGLPGLGNGDGVTVLASAFGGTGGVGCNSGADLNTGFDPGTGTPYFTEGGTLVHEVGHYLGLFHTWGDDDLFGTPPYCGTLDNGNAGPFVVNDTPDQGASSDPSQPCPTLAGATCASLPATCGSNDYFHNYMDYANDVCQTMFTNDQALVTNYWANQLFAGSTIATFTVVPTSMTTVCDMTACVACEDEVTYEVVATGCDMTGATIDLQDNTGNLVTSMPLANEGGVGTFGLVPCADYQIVITNAPTCYTDAGGDVGPRQFTADGNGTKFQSFQSFVESIPTLSEWGLITLALLLMSYGTIAIAGVGAFAGTNNVNTPIGFQLPFNGAVLRKAFIITAVLVTIGFTCSVLLFGAIFISDIIGVLIAAPVFAYLTHLMLLVEKKK